MGNVTKKQVDEQYSRYKKMIKENELSVKRDIKRVLEESDISEQGDYLVPKIAFIMMAEQITPFTDTYRKDFNKFLYKFKLK